jgi:hypothetical protein
MPPASAAPPAVTPLPQRSPCARLNAARRWGVVRSQAKLARRLDKDGGAMADEHEVTNEEVLLRKAKLLKVYAAAKPRLQTLQDAARIDQKVLNGIVEYLKSGGDYRRVAGTVDSYLTGTLTKLMQDMWVVCVEMEALEKEPRVSALRSPIDARGLCRPSPPLHVHRHHQARPVHHYPSPRRARRHGYDDAVKQDQRPPIHGAAVIDCGKRRPAFVGHNRNPPRDSHSILTPVTSRRKYHGFK